MAIVRFLALALVTSFAAPALTQSGSYFGQTSVGDDFSELTIRNSDGNRIKLYLRIDEADGFYVICAATAGAKSDDDEELMHYALILLNEQVIMRDLGWAPNHINARGRRASCYKTGARIVANPTFRAEWARYDF